MSGMPRWTVHLEGGPRRVNHAAVAIGDLIYTFGGYCTGDASDTRPMDVHQLNTNTYRWHVVNVRGVSVYDAERGFIPHQRYGHTAVEMRGNAFIWGGRNDTKGACNILYKFDAGQHLWRRVNVSGCIPGKRDGHSACIVNEEMYIFGGYEEEVEKFSNEIHSYNFDTSMWSLLEVRGKPALWRDFHSAVGRGDHMIIFGGRSDRGGPYHTSLEIYSDKIQIFDTKHMTWFEPNTTGLQPTGRRSHSAFIYNGDMYVFGGFDGIHNIHFDDVYRYRPDVSEWSLIKVSGKSPCPRRRQCCCVEGDRVFIFGGTSPVQHHSSPTPHHSELQDQSDLHVLDFAPNLRTLCLLYVINNKNVDATCLPKSLQHEMSAMTKNNNITRPANMNG